ncbi:hypothetical protein GH714_031432 [Hevea brasiliensis]|uniref:Uncharacterized protein n=1 Tax=Hevea brasiliensis TaxID=3981 RepID=A0A6A6LFG7_HEVBR|nr:hypothetical protein GH714_031432 [Hevea brasiliensis]
MNTDMEAINNPSIVSLEFKKLPSLRNQKKHDVQDISDSTHKKVEEGSLPHIDDLNNFQLFVYWIKVTMRQFFCPMKNMDNIVDYLMGDMKRKLMFCWVHTAIFPYSYQCQDRKDNALGDGGDLRVYLEGLAEADNVQKFVEQHPFGKKPITEEVHLGFLPEGYEHMSLLPSLR